MPLERTTVDAGDLAVIRKAAARDHISEADIIRNAIHQAARRLLRPSGPLELRRFNSGDPYLAERVDDIIAGWSDGLGRR